MLSPLQRCQIQLLIIIQVAREIPDLKVIRSNRVGLNISFFANSPFFFGYEYICRVFNSLSRFVSQLVNLMWVMVILRVEVKGGLYSLTR
jgi:hypothetical protein